MKAVGKRAARPSESGDDADARRACLGGRFLAPSVPSTLTTVTMSKVIATQTCHGILVDPFRSDREAIHGENVRRIVTGYAPLSPSVELPVDELLR